MHSKRDDIQRLRRSLPIFEAKEALIEAIQSGDNLVIVGETGSGKSTQLPQFAFDALRGHQYGARRRCIGITQPRRVAAVTLAQRVSDEMGVELGSTVGYAIRFEHCASPQTRIKFLTDGVLLREAMSDELLLSYSVIVLDEAHERSVHTDILFGLLKQIQQRRTASSKHPLQIVVMSATLNAQLFADYFDARILLVQGRQYAVRILHTKEPQLDVVDACLTTVLQIHDEQPPGDILVFMTGQEHIEALALLLNTRLQQLPEAERPLVVRPIFAALPSDQQMKVFERAPSGVRKVVLATNIAETSITIDGVRYVVDTGLAKVRGFDTKLGMELLTTAPISKANAWQRAGRAGRQQEGMCFRLYTTAAFDSLAPRPSPEIARCNLSSVVLQLKAMNVSNVLDFPFLERPSAGALKHALKLLFTLGALDPGGELTDDIGRPMARFPLDPCYARILIAAPRFGCTVEMLSILAMLSVDDTIFFSSYQHRADADRAKLRFGGAHGGDALLLLAVYRQYVEQRRSARWCRENFLNARALRKAESIRAQLEQYCASADVALVSCAGVDEAEAIIRCFVTGLFMNCALLQADTRRYRTLIDAHEIRIHPSSVMSGRYVPCILYTELVRTQHAYARGVMPCERQWLQELAPQLFMHSDA